MTLIKLILKSFSYHSTNFYIIVGLLSIFHGGFMPDVDNFWLWLIFVVSSSAETFIFLAAQLTFREMWK